MLSSNIFSVCRMQHFESNTSYCEAIFQNVSWVKKSWTFQNVKLCEESNKGFFSKSNIEVENKMLAFPKSFQLPSITLSFRTQCLFFRNNSQHYQNRHKGFRLILFKDHSKSEQLCSMICWGGRKVSICTSGITLPKNVLNNIPQEMSMWHGPLHVLTDLCFCLFALLLPTNRSCCVSPACSCCNKTLNNRSKIVKKASWII